MVKRFSLFLLCFTLFFGAILPLDRGIAANGTITIAADSVNIRKGPSLSYPLVKQVKKGDKFTIVKEKDDWIEIYLPSGKTGWVANWLVKKSNGESSSAVSSNKNAAEANTDQLRVRSGPGTSFRIIGYLNKGQAVMILEENETWLKISASFGEGWVARQYISFNSGKKAESKEENKTTGEKAVVTDILNVRKEPSTTGTILGKISKGTTVTIYSKKNNWVEIKFKDQTGWVSAEYVQIGGKTETPSSKDKGTIGTVTASNLNVRKDYSQNASIIGSVSKGESYPIVEEVNNWVKIEFQPGRFGWAAGWYFNRDKETPKQPVKESTITVLHDGSNIRKNATVQSDVVLRANEGETYPVKSIRNDWYEIDLPNGSSGFIAGWIVSTNDSTKRIEKKGADDSLQSKTIVIDPGHGGVDDGASGRSGTSEKELTLRTAKLLYDKLKASGANVFLTRSNDSFISLPSRVRMASTHGADAFISLHYDSSLDQSVRGMTGYYYHSYQKALATYVYNATNAQTRLKSRGVRTGDFHVVRENPQRAVLMELGYLSNSAEEMTLKSSQYQENAATGLYNGLALYFKEK
ncbi:SH3 domain-containing protein [Neobacillus sp. K501]